MSQHPKHTATERGQLSYWLALAVGIALTLSAGALYGKYSQRWGPTVDLNAAAARLDKLPDQLGDWKLVERLTMDKANEEMLQCAGYLFRRYVNERTGQAISVAIIVGPPGPTAVHTPEICYSSRAYDVSGERRRVVFDSSPSGNHSLWSNDFSTKNPLADNLRVYYGWSRGQSWEASDSPRYQFAAEPLLYKIQLAVTIGPGANDKKPDACREFLEIFLKSGWPILKNQ